MTEIRDREERDMGATNMLDALDPVRSAVVEACAGSGKTWLLASRIVRLLLAGARPAEILAITFTRKAACEIEARVVDWLRLLATAGDDEVRHFLRERGAATDAGTLHRARGLYEQLTRGTQPGLAVNTFHGWFLQLVAVAPLSSGLAGTTLADDDGRRFEELWQTFARRLQREAQGPVGAAFVRLLADVGLSGTRTLLERGLARRAEWLARIEGEEAPVPAVVDDLRRLSGLADETEGGALERFFAAGLEADLQAYLGLLEMSELETDRRLAAQLATALSDDDSRPEPRFEAIAGVFLTGTGTLRSRKAGKALDARYGVAGARRLLELHAALGERVQACLAARREERNLEFNRDALGVFHAFVEHLEEFKRARRQIDFVDAEWRVRRLLADDETAAFIQARLDARYRHVLVDEFQDTNPLQWQILQSWLAAYTDAARPSLFLVGDPKQSIYRFRRAEPRLFACAATFLAERFDALRLTQDVTRRNAPPIIDVVNALFSSEPAFQPFRTQRSLAHGLPGCAMLLPLCHGEGGETAAAVDEGSPPVLRDPLREAADDPVDGRRRQEDEAIAGRLAGMLGRTMIVESRPAGSVERPLRPGDVLLLVRKRSRIRGVEQALAAAGIPFAAASRGGLLDSLEVTDVVALLEFLVTPAADLPLAHALRSPIFACTDADLLLLAARPERSWRERLAACAADASATPALARAAALIEGWLPAAASLPAHDLLDRIHHEGELAARYRAAVPPARCAAALANLDALLLLALDLDGGRYPSLPRFIDELKSMRRLAGDDAPDEGELADDASWAGNGRVRIMTIHGAKGLEAPLVWLVDANAPPSPASAWDVLVDWPPYAERPSHFSFFGRVEDRGGSRAGMFAAEAAAAEREELNLLYVAITRARQIFVASGIVSGRRSETPSFYDRLSAAFERLGAEGVHGAPLPECPAVPPAAMPRGEAPGRAPDLPAVGERRAAIDDGARFGILLHGILERRTGLWEEEGWWRDAGYGDDEAVRAGAIAGRLLDAPALRRFFDAASHLRAWNELELCDERGAILRIDRLVESKEAFWLLDYKSSGPDTPRLEEYRAQVLAYCRAVAAIHPEKPVRGVLVFADASLLEVV